MFISAADAANAKELEADIVIVGAGAAGITIARHFAGRSKSVILLESGGFEYNDDVQSLYQGTRSGIVVDPPLEASRLRYFGGTTNHWTGWCRPLEAADFEKRADWPESGWPITRADLDPYYSKAVTICGLRQAVFDDFAFWQRQKGGNKIALLPFDPALLRSAIFQVSPPVRFGEKYGPELKAARNVRVLINSTVLELTAAPGHHADQVRKRISGVRVRHLNGATAIVSGRAVIVATGGIESARLLLLSNKVHPAGAGNEHDLVGRYFMDHVWLNANCYVHFTHPGLELPVYFDQLKLADARLFAAVAPSRKLLEREKIGAFRLWLNPTSSSSEGIDAAHDFSDSLVHGRLPQNFLSDLGNMLADIDVLADAAYKTIFHTNKGWISSTRNAPNTGAWVDLNFEQRPNRESRVMLADDRDKFGQRRVHLDWRLSETDRMTAMRALEIAAQEFGRMGLGRARINIDLRHDASWPANMISSCHHSGTARMSNDPHTGVVDADCRVHSTDNLYVAGSAVFPTAGYANPTLTIVALAQRLAEHLERTLI